jgi:hypothetical protein
MEPAMSIIITRTVFTTTVTPNEQIRHDVPFFAGELLRVRRDYDWADGCDWLALPKGGVIGVPDDAWKMAE